MACGRPAVVQPSILFLALARGNLCDAWPRSSDPVYHRAISKLPWPNYSMSQHAERSLSAGDVFVRGAKRFHWHQVAEQPGAGLIGEWCGAIACCPSRKTWSVGRVIGRSLDEIAAR